MERNYCSYLPPYYEGIREFEWLGETVDAELQGVAAGADKWLNDQFVLTASEASLKRRKNSSASRLTRYRNRWISGKSGS